MELAVTMRLGETPRAIALGSEARILVALYRDEWCICGTQNEQKTASFAFPWQDGDHRFERIAISEDGSCVVVARGQRIGIYEIGTDVLIEAEIGSPITGIDVGATGMLIVVASSTGHLHVLKREGSVMSQVRAIPLGSGIPGGGFQPFAIRPDETCIAVPSAGRMSSVDLFSPTTGEIIGRADFPAWLVAGLAFSRDASELIGLVVKEKPFSYLAWNLAAGTVSGGTHIDGPSDGLHTQVLSPFGEFMASIHEGNRHVQIQELPSGNRTCFGRSICWKTTVSADGKYVGALDSGYLFRIWGPRLAPGA